MAAGRPPKYKTPEEMQKTIDVYFLACRVHQDGNTDRLEYLNDDELLVINDIEDIFPSISGLAYTLGMTTETLRQYGNEDEFSATVKRAKQRVEMSLEQRLNGKAVTGSIFSLKNNFGWKDKQDVEHSGNMSVTIDSDDAGSL